MQVYTGNSNFLPFMTLFHMICISIISWYQIAIKVA